MGNIYPALGALIGGGTGALDKIDGAGLADGDAATVVLDSGVYHYHLDATSGASENSPYVISPDTNAGTKRWLLVTPAGAFSHVRAHQTSVQSIVSGDWRTVTWDVEVHDNLSEFVLGTGIFTPGYTGKYLISAGVTTASIAWTAGEIFYLAAAIDDVNYAFGSRSIAWTTSTARQSASISMVIPLLDTENLRLKASSNRTVDTSGSSTGVWLTIDRIA